MRNSKARILVVDDEPRITRLIRLNLEQTGEFSVREENNAAHALLAARDFLPDLILLDVLMPGEDGGELASKFQENPLFRHIPIVFLTAAVTRAEVDAHHGYVGGLPFLPKPVDIPELVACLRAQMNLPASSGPDTPEPEPP